MADGGHAVTVVGYENKTGAIADTVFVFKNSWGIRWGSGGYGYATYAYVLKNLTDAVLLEVAAGTSP
jgi:C1A family cysteine protease